MEVLFSGEDSLPADDRGLAYGDGLFETIRVNGREPVLGKAHQCRLERDSKALDIPLDPPVLSNAFFQALSRWGNDAGRPWVLKVVLTRGSGGRGYRLPVPQRPRLVLSAHPCPRTPSGSVRTSLSRHRLVVDPSLAGMKTLNRLPQVLASRVLQGGSPWESLMTDAGGRLLEGTRTNLALRREDGWVLPPGNTLAVCGIARELLIKKAEEQGASLRFMPIPVSMLNSQRTTGLVLMNSVTGFVPVESLGCMRCPGTDAFIEEVRALNQTYGWV